MIENIAGSICSLEKSEKKKNDFVVVVGVALIVITFVVPMFIIESSII